MHSSRKVIAVGRSTAIIIPPHIMDHLHAQKGDFLIFDDRYENFCLIVKSMIPPLEQIAIDFPSHPIRTAQDTANSLAAYRPSPPSHCGPSTLPVPCAPGTTADGPSPAPPLDLPTQGPTPDGHPPSALANPP